MVMNKRTKKNVVSRKNSKKHVAVGSKPANKVSFAARLGAFILDDHKGKIRWSEKTGFAAGQPHIFGILPFFHMNITENKFREMLSQGRSQQVASLSKVCTSKKLDKVLEAVDFHCDKQCPVGVKAITESVISSINSPERWNSRRNGRRVLSAIQKLMHKQESMGSITKQSLVWGH